MASKRKTLPETERRQSIRARRVLSVQYRFSKTRPGKSETGWHLSTTEDMSLDGLSFYSDMEAREGDELDVHVVMSGVLDIFNGKARVVRVEKPESGSTYFIAVRFDLRKTHQSTRRAKTHRVKKTSPAK
jgi:c-di-GMP-binding flagellar brake protein YcgR